MLTEVGRASCFAMSYSKRFPQIRIMSVQIRRAALDYAESTADSVQAIGVRRRCVREL
jgi:hypothetical protein